jgi:hypothetical protein
MTTVGVINCYRPLWVNGRHLAGTENTEEAASLEPLSLESCREYSELTQQKMLSAYRLENFPPQHYLSYYKRRYSKKLKEHYHVNSGIMDIQY